MLGMPDHHFHALIARERAESLRATMIASRRSRRRRHENSREENEAGHRMLRLEPRHYAFRSS
jgi:hypothetical protein